MYEELHNVHLFIAFPWQHAKKETNKHTETKASLKEHI